MRKQSVAAEESQSRETSMAWTVLAFWGPLAFIICSLAWAITGYLIVREKARVQIELAHLEVSASE